MWLTQVHRPDIEIPEGTRLAHQTVSIPQSERWRNTSVEVFEDGWKLDDLSPESGIPIPSPRGHSTWSEATPAILIVDSDAPPNANRQQNLGLPRPSPASPEDVRRLPDIRHLAALYPNLNISNDPSFFRFGERTSDAFTLQVLALMPQVEMLPPGDLPTKWIDYTCFDLTFVSLDDLKSMANKNPDRWQAIRDWVATGPTLCVYDMSLDAHHLEELEKLLELAPMPNAESDASELRGWSPPDAKRGSKISIEGLDELYENARRRRGPSHSPLLDVLTTGGRYGRKPKEMPFVSRNANLGRVIALGTNEPFSPGAYGISRLMNEIGDENWMWYQRHGMSLHRENGDYWTQMIPGVGSAPVGSYLVLISLFAVVIGPVNYIFLRKKKRLYLLLVTVPVGAGLVTLALLNYALISDGLGVRARVRSYAEIDQTTERAVSWSRQTYYAGLAPSGGLGFPTGAAIYPLEYYPSNRRRQRRSDRWLDWDEEQRLTSGYLGARSTAQFMVVQSHRSRRGLDIIEPADQKNALRVTNKLDAGVAKVLICDSAGRYHWAENVETGEEFRPRKINATEAAQQLRLSYNENRPEVPKGFDPRHYRNSLGFSRYWRTDVDQGLSPPALNQSVLERGVQRAMYTDASAMKPRTYIAITRTTTEASLGYQASREEASFHVVVGRW